MSRSGDKLEISHFHRGVLSGPRGDLQVGGTSWLPTRNSDIAVIRLAHDRQDARRAAVMSAEEGGRMARAFRLSASAAATARGRSAGWKRCCRKVKVQRPGDKAHHAGVEDGGSSRPRVAPVDRCLTNAVWSSASPAVPTRACGYYVHIEEIQHFLKKNSLAWLYEEDRK